MYKKFILLLIVFYTITFTVFSNGSKENSGKNIALFIPGELSGSPVYQMLNDGVTKAVNEYNSNPKTTNKINLSIFEAQSNQAEWGKKLTALVAQQKYDVIISSNPSMPDFAKPILKDFPDQKFIFLDAYESGNPNIATIQYNQREQAYLAGYSAGLVTTDSSLLYANKDLKIALVAAQEYPVMNTIILPGFIEGAQAVNPDISVEFRIVGNWYDATKGAEIAKSLYDSGVDVILPIAGGASQGIISAAKQYGFYITWFDDNGFNKAPGYIVSSSVMSQEKMAYEQTKLFLEGKTKFGSAKTVGIKDGYVQFILDDPLFIKTVPESIRKKMTDVYENIKSGTLVLEQTN
ncbi:MAG: BMP family ABC transporter substrate-binding protein [Treponema sp. CETP13]|nr:MAG: BMP family ABC transporter substrate-binding protein [Treponema sp. CETP13]